MCILVNTEQESPEKEQSEVNNERFFEDEGDGNDFIEVEISSNIPSHVGDSPEKMVQLKNETHINEIIDRESYEPEKSESFINDDNEIFDLEVGKDMEAEGIPNLQLDSYDELDNSQNNDSLDEGISHELHEGN